MPNEQRVYDKRNHNIIVIVPTFGPKGNEPPAKKPKLDSTPEKEVTKKCDTKSTPDKTTTPKKDVNEDSKKADPTCVKKEVKVQSWASSYLQSIGQQARPRMSLSSTNNNMASVQPTAPGTQSNIAHMSNLTPTNLPTQYLYPNPLNYNFQAQSSMNTTSNAFCSLTPLNYNGPVNYTSPINYTVPLNYAASLNYSAPQNYSAPIDNTALLNYTAPLNYPAPTNDTAPINYNAPFNYTTSLSEPLNYTMPLTDSLMQTTESNTPLKSPTTPLIDEPISPLSERTLPIYESATLTSLQYEPISPLSDTTTPIILNNTQKIDTQLANIAPENERFINDSIKTEKATSKTNTSTKSKIKLNLINNKNDINTTSNSENQVFEHRKYKIPDRIRCTKDMNIQFDKHAKRSDPTSSSKEKITNVHESKSLKSAIKRKFIESHKSVIETSKADYSKKENLQKKQPSEHHRYHESESHRKKDTKEGKHTKSDYNKHKIIEKMKEIRSLYEKAKRTSNKKVNVNKPSTSKIRRSRTPEPVQKKRPGPDSGNADKDRSTKKISPVKSVVQPIKKIKYSTVNPKSHSPEQNDPGVPEHFDLRSKLSRANRYFQKNRYSKNNLQDCDNLVVTINQQDMNTESKPKSPPKVTVTEKKMKSKTKKYKTIKFTIKVLCQDGEGSATSQSDDSEEELNTGEVASSQNDFSFLDDFNVDEIVDSLNNSQKHSKDSVSKNNKLNDILYAVSETSNDNETHDIQVNDSNDCIIVEDNIKTEIIKIEQNDNENQDIQVDDSNDCIIVEDNIKTKIIKIEQKYDGNFNESNDCVKFDTIKLVKVKTDVYDKNNDSNDCVILSAANITNIKTEHDVINETNKSLILDNTIDIISIKSEPSDNDDDMKPNIKIKSETLEKSNYSIVELENHPIKIEDSDDNILMNNTKAQDIQTELDTIANKNENVNNINRSMPININENLNPLYDEDTMELLLLWKHVDENENTQGLDNNITDYNCYSEPSATAAFELIDVKPEHGEVEKTALNIDNNEATKTEYKDVKQDLSNSNSDAIIKAVETPNIIEKEPMSDNIKIVDTIYDQDTNKYVHKTEKDTNVIKDIEIPVPKEPSQKKEPLMEIEMITSRNVSNSDAIIKDVEIPNNIEKEPTKDNIKIVDTIHDQDTNHNVHKTEKNTNVIEEIEIPVPEEQLMEIELITSQNVKINNKVTPKTKNASEKNTSDSSKKANSEKHEKVNNIEVISKNSKPVSLTKENIDCAHETKKKQELIHYVCEAKGLTIEKVIKQEIINNIEPELAHLNPKDSQAIINAVAVRAEEVINTPKPETSNVKSKDNKVPDPVATKTVETEKRQVTIVKKKEDEELGEIKEQLEARMFEYLHEQYTISSLIYEGRFSQIYKCNDSRNRNCVVKLLKHPRDRFSSGVEKEKILQKIQRDIPKENLNIVMVIDGFGFERRWALIMDYYPNDLKTLLLKSKKGFSLNELQGLAKQLIMAIMVLRNYQIVHSDIKPSHILLDESRQRLKLCGFDSCYYANTTKVLPNIGTVSYRAPEIIMGFSASFSIDVWSAGTVLYEMFTRKKLFLGIFNNQVLFNQLCTLGEMPPDMIQGSPFQSRHFEGLRFVRKMGNRGMKRQLYDTFFKTQRLYNSLQSSYNFFWGMSKTVSRRDDLCKLYCFYELLEKILVFDPRRRLPIEFVCADPFITEHQ